MFKLLNYFTNSIQYSPETLAPSGTGISTGTGSKQSTSDLIQLEDLETKPEEVIDLKPEKKALVDEEADVDDKKEHEEEEDELDYLLEETEDPTEEQLELVTPSNRRAILKDYPDLFKKHPSLEKSYYRDQKFTEVFPHPKDAEEARGKVEALDSFEKDIMDGNTEAILRSVKDGSSDSFNKVVDNLLPTLMKIDREAYLHIVGNNAKEIIRHMWTTGSNSSNEDEKSELQNAARTMNKFLFGSEKYAPPSKLSSTNTSDKVNPKEEELARKEKEFNDRQFNNSKNEVMSSIDRQIKATINKHIDPKDSMPEYVKKNAIRDANEILESQLKSDKRFQEIINRLWENAKKNDFSKESVDKVRQAHTSKASALLASVIKKARNEALKGIGKRVKDEEPDDSADENESPRRAKPRAPSNAGRDSKDDNKFPRRGETTAEFLARV